MTKDIEKRKDMHLTLQELQYKNLYAEYIWTKKTLKIKEAMESNYILKFVGVSEEKAQIVVKNEVYFNNVKLLGLESGGYTEYRKPKSKKSDNFLSKIFGLNKFHEWFNKNIE